MTRIIKANEVNVTAIFKWHSRNLQLKLAVTLTALKLILVMGSEIILIATAKNDVVEESRD